MIPSRELSLIINTTMIPFYSTDRLIFTNDNYTPIMAETKEQYHGVLELFPYRNVEFHSLPFPKYFPFSGMVSQVYCQLKAFISNCTDYADKLNLRYMIIIVVHYYC